MLTCSNNVCLEPTTNCWSPAVSVEVRACHPLNNLRPAFLLPIPITQGPLSLKDFSLARRLLPSEGKTGVSKAGSCYLFLLLWCCDTVTTSCRERRGQVEPKGSRRTSLDTAMLSGKTTGHYGQWYLIIVIAKFLRVKTPAMANFKLSIHDCTWTCS